jgi:hypothetical protein
MEINSLSRRRGTASSKKTGEKERGRERENLVEKAHYEYDLKKYHTKCIDSASKLLTTKVLLLIAAFLALVCRQIMMTSAGIEPDVSPVDYKHDGYALQGFLSLPESGSGHTHTQSPAVIIVP